MLFSHLRNKLKDPFFFERFFFPASISVFDSDSTLAPRFPGLVGFCCETPVFGTSPRVAWVSSAGRQAVYKCQFPGQPVGSPLLTLRTLGVESSSMTSWQAQQIPTGEEYQMTRCRHRDARLPNKQGPLRKWLFVSSFALSAIHPEAKLGFALQTASPSRRGTRDQERRSVCLLLLGVSHPQTRTVAEFRLRMYYAGSVPRLTNVHYIALLRPLHRNMLLGRLSHATYPFLSVQEATSFCSSVGLHGATA